MNANEERELHTSRELQNHLEETVKEAKNKLGQSEFSLLLQQLEEFIKEEKKYL